MKTALAEVSELSRMKKPRAFAILRDDSRRGGVRVAVVKVRETWEPMGGAAVQELRDAKPHVLPFSRLARITVRGSELRARVAEHVFRRVQEEAKSAAADPLAGMTCTR